MKRTESEINTEWECITKALKSCVLAVKFEKADGTVRELICSQCESVITAPPLHVAAGKKQTPNPDCANVWDLENAGWRRFCKGSVISFEILEAIDLGDE